jgi:hypothetical protein
VVLWWPFWKWRPVEIFQCWESIQDIIIYPQTISTGRHFQNGHHNIAKIQHCPISSQFDMWVHNDVPNWFPTLKNFYRSSFSTPLMVTYYYVKFYVSIIIHLEVININVRNFKFPIGFYSNPHPLWTPKNMALSLQCLHCP